MASALYGSSVQDTGCLRFQYPRIDLTSKWSIVRRIPVILRFSQIYKLGAHSCPSNSNKNLLFSNPLLPACLRRFHEGCPEGEPAVHAKAVCTLVGGKGMPDMIFRLTTCKQEQEERKWEGTIPTLKPITQVQNRGNQWPNKMDPGPTNVRKEKNLFWQNRRYKLNHVV